MRLNLALNNGYLGLVVVAAALFGGACSSGKGASDAGADAGGGDAAPGAGQMPGVSASGFGHASCHGYNAAGNATDTALVLALPPTR
jgi:hypothetical protein